MDLRLPDVPIPCQTDSNNCPYIYITYLNEVFSLYRINWNPIFAFFIFGRKEVKITVIININPENVGSIGGGGDPSSYLREKSVLAYGVYIYFLSCMCDFIAPNGTRVNKSLSFSTHFFSLVYCKFFLWKKNWF